MDEIIVRTLFLLAGLAIGYTIAMVRNTMLYTKDIRDHMESCKTLIEQHNDHGGHTA